MSFGWSAGDIAAAIKLAHRIYETLDSCHGAAREYREATSLREIATMGKFSHNAAELDQDAARESLREVYCLVLLYLGEFLKNLLYVFPP